MKKLVLGLALAALGGFFLLASNYTAAPFTLTGIPAGSVINDSDPVKPTTESEH